MESWVLIISLAMGGITSGAVALDHIPGFASKDECEKAGEQWKATMDRVNGVVSPICVKQSGVTGAAKAAS